MRRYKYAPISRLDCVRFILNRLLRKLFHTDGFSSPFNLKNTIFVTEDGYLFKVHDPACLSAIKRDSLIIHTVLSHVSQISTVVDVGAHVGSISIRIADNVRKVIAVEPDPRNFTCLVENVVLNKKHNIIPILAGAGDRDILERFKLAGTSTHSTFVSDHYVEETVTTCLVPIYRLDTIARLLDLPSIDLIKIDVEGFETQVLAGAVNVLKKYTPILLVEAHGDDRRIQVIETLQRLDLSYECKILRVERGERYDTYQLLLFPKK